MTPRYCVLPYYACIEVRGADAAAFLQGQLSRTVSSLDRTHAPLAGWHDARGRLRALFRVVRLPESWLLITAADVAVSAASRLRMYVLRAAVTIAPTDQWAAAAVVGAGRDWLDARGAPSGAPTGSVATRGDLRWLRLGPTLWQLVGPRAALDAFEPELARAPADVAVLEEIRLGIPSIDAALVERFVPQMLNLDLLDAISFDKGCYPGQEVIARVHHRGSVKRRMRRYACESATPPRPTSEVATADGAVVGEVVRGASAERGSEVLAVVDHAAAAAELRVAGAPLRELPLPYLVPNE